MEENKVDHPLLRKSQQNHLPVHCLQEIVNKIRIICWLKVHCNAVGTLKTKFLLLDVSIHLLVDLQWDSHNNCSEYLLKKILCKCNVLLSYYGETGSEFEQADDHLCIFGVESRYVDLNLWLSSALHSRSALASIERRLLNKQSHNN